MHLKEHLICSKLPVAKFMKLLNRKYCLKNFLVKQKLSWHQSQLCNVNVVLAGNLFLLSNTFLCLASFCAYRLEMKLSPEVT